MGTILKGATLVELEPASVEAADLRIVGGKIVQRAKSLEPEEGDEVISLAGRYLLPGFVSAQHRPYSLALRGRPRKGQGFPAEQALLEAVEAALEPDDLEAFAAAAALEGLTSGTTTVVSVFQSSKAQGTSERVAKGLNEVGVRGVVACEVSDRHGAVVREEALESAAAFAKSAKGRVRGAVGLTGLGTLSDDTLNGVRAVLELAPVPVVVTVGEDPAEEKVSQERFGAQPVDRLLDAGLVTSKSILAQLVNLSWPDLARVLGTGAWLALASRANMAAQAGVATAGKFGVRGCLATGTSSLDLLEEARVAWLRSRDAAQPIDPLRFLTNGSRLAGDVFGVPMGTLREGTAADLVVLDYAPATPFDAGSLANHLVSGLSSRHVESVMVDGLWRLWKRRPLSVDPVAVNQAVREASERVWAKVLAS